MYYAFTLNSVFKSVPPLGSELTWKTSLLNSDIVPLIYVNETICMVVCPSTRFKLSFYGLGWTFWCQDYPKMHLMGEGPGAILSFKTFLSFINRLLVTTSCPGGSEVKAVCLQFWRPWFKPWVRKIPWRRKWQPTPVFLPGESQGWGSLVGCRLWGHTESDMTEAT